MQKALFIESKQGPWKIDQRPIPKPGKGEVLVKIQAAALNPVDWRIKSGGFFVDNFPAVIGLDSSGEIEEIGEGVANLKKGDRVLNQGWFRENDKSAFQQYTICPAEIVAKIPAHLSFTEAASIPLGLATAVVGFFNPVNETGIGLTPFWAADGKTKYANKPIVVFGGSSSVGQYAIQVARLSGFSPIITTSSNKHTDFLKSIGATVVLDRSLPAASLTNSLKAVKDIDVVYDAISSAETQAIALDITGPNAKILLTLPKSEKLDFGERTVVNTFGNVHAQRKLGIQLYSVLPGLLESGDIKPNRVEVLKGGLGAIPAGLERMEKGEVSGVKLVVNPWE